MEMHGSRGRGAMSGGLGVVPLAYDGASTQALAFWAKQQPRWRQCLTSPVAFFFWPLSYLNLGWDRPVPY